MSENEERNVVAERILDDEGLPVLEHPVPHIGKVEAEVPVVAGEFQDDVYDGFYREIISREVANREGRPEDRSLVVELPEGEGNPDFISYGQGEMVKEFDLRLKKAGSHRGIDVGRFPADDPEKVGKLRTMYEHQVSEATDRRKGFAAKRGWPALPPVLENTLVAIESKLPALPGSRIIENGGQDNGNDK